MNGCYRFLGRGVQGLDSLAFDSFDPFIVDEAVRRKLVNTIWMDRGDNYSLILTDREAARK